MPEKPVNPRPDPGKPEDRPTPPKPEQIWPPPAPEAIRNGDEDVGLDWSEEVEKIDQAIDEIRKLNGGLKEEPPEADDALEAILAEEDELPQAEAIAGDSDDLLAGLAEPIPAPPKKSAKPIDEIEIEPAAEPPVEKVRPAPTAESITPARRRVRPQSENELAQLWSSVFFSGEHVPPRAVVVTGVRRGDGATQIATSLALLGAESNEELRIALVDFNLRTPTIAHLLGLKREPGLSDVLSGKLSLDTAMQVLALKNGNHLHVLTGGSRPDHPLGQLKSRQAQALIARLKERFDHVIIDVASADRHADPQVIGAQVDGAILVLRAGQTPRETVAEARKRLELGGARCLGLVMNQRSDPIPSLLYGMT